MKIKKVLDVLEEIAPLYLAASWDNCGLLIGDPDQDIKKALFALEVTQEIIENAQKEKAQLIVTHHPLIFSPITKIEKAKYPGKLLFSLIEKGICLIAMHTNWDASDVGVASQLAQIIGLKDVSALSSDDGIPIGRVGELSEPISAVDLGYKLMRRLNGSYFAIAGDEKRRAERIACCPGSGGDMWRVALKEGAEIYVTGEIRYHQVREAIQEGLTVLILGHFTTENFSIFKLAEEVKKRLPELGIKVDNCLKEPFRIFK